MKVRKGEQTRSVILAQAIRLASTVGLEALTIGSLARRLNLSKSGLFAHFHSKENLQLEVVHAAAALFTDKVVRPAIRAPRGEPRVQALFDRWLQWAQRSLPGGCVFVTAAVEMDDRPGPVRDAVVDSQRQWLATLRRAVELAVQEGHFHRAVDSAQLAFEIHALMLGHHHASRLLRDPQADARTRRAFAALLARARVHAVAGRVQSAG